MKTILSSFIVLIAVSFNALCEPIGLERSLQIAKDFFSQNNVSDYPLKVVNLTTRARSESDQEPFYIINNSSGGFIIVSNEKTTRPILAYSLDNQFIEDGDAIPENLSDWLKMLEEQIIYARTHPTNTRGANKQVRSDYNSPKTTSRSFTSINSRAI